MNMKTVSFSFYVSILSSVAGTDHVSISKASVSHPSLTLKGIRTGPLVSVVSRDVVKLDPSNVEWNGIKIIRPNGVNGSFNGIDEMGRLFSCIEHALTSSEVSFIPKPIRDVSTNHEILCGSISLGVATEAADQGKPGDFVLTDSSSTSILYFSGGISSIPSDGSITGHHYEDALALCPSSVRDAITACPVSTHLPSIISLPPESGQSIGSVLFLCGKPVNEGTEHLSGFACNPSTGDSWSFAIESDADVSFVDWHYCPSCEPSQVFILTHTRDTLKVETVLVSALHFDGAIISRADDFAHGRMRLFDVPLNGPEPRSLAITKNPKAEESLSLYISFAPDETKATKIIQFEVNFAEEGIIELEEIDSSSTSLSWIIVITLLAAGIGLPIYINRRPQLKARIESLLTRKPIGAVALPIDESISERLPIKTQKETSPTFQRPLEIVIE